MGPQLVFALAVALGVPAALVMLRRARTERSSRTIVVMLLSGTLWSLAGLGMTLTHDPEVLQALYAWSAPMFAMGAAGVLWQALSMSGRDPARAPWLVAALSADAVVTAVVAAAPGLRGYLAEVTVGTDGVAVMSNGPMLYTHSVIAGGMAVTGGALLLTGRMRAVTGHRGRFAVATVAMGVPTLAAIGAVATAREPVEVVAAASAGFVVTVVVWSARLIYRGDLSTPLAVHQVLAAIGDAVVVTDDRGMLAQVNPAARVMLARWGTAEPEGRHWSAVIDQEAVARLQSSGTMTAPDGAVLDVRSSTITAGGRPVATVAVVRDVTEVDRLRHQLAEQAVRDGLTGLHNRRHLDRVLTGSGLLDGGAPLTAVMVDVDRFKSVNDHFGHAVGDRVLVAVAGVLSRDLRADDVLVRFGGEEFLALLPGTAAADVAERAEHWRAACSAQSVPTDDGPVRVTVSIGVAQSLPGDDADDLLRRADAALYAAKRAGRDRVVGASATGGGA